MNENRGRSAETPLEIPFDGWKDIGARVVKEIKDDHTVLAAAGVAFFSFLALIPGLAAAVSIYGLIADPATIQSQLADLLGPLPEDARQLITDQMDRIARQSTGALGWSMAVSIAVALWTASSGMSHLIGAVNLTYDEDDSRSFLRKRSLALLFTLGAVVLLAASGFAVGTVGPWLASVTGSGALNRVGTAITWLVVGLAFMAALAVVYRFAPRREDPEWSWVSVGSLVAVIIWLAASILFQIYVQNFGSYNETYGSLAAVVIAMFWLFITSFVVLLAAQINSEMEHQTREDTTVGPDEPMGERGAIMADTLGRTREEFD